MDKLVVNHLKKVGSRHNQPLVELGFNEDTKLIFIRRRDDLIQARLEKTQPNGESASANSNNSIVDIRNLDSITLSASTMELSWRWSINERRHQYRLSIDTNSGSCSLYLYKGKDFLAQVQF